jgi:hypothetical protein
MRFVISSRLPEYLVNTLIKNPIPILIDLVIISVKNIQIDALLLTLKVGDLENQVKSLLIVELKT